MNADEIKYYRTKAATLLEHRYEDYAWSSTEEFGSQDKAIDSIVRKLKGLPEGKLYGFVTPYTAPPPVADSGTFSEQVAEAKGMLSQPNAYTCQSTSIAMATGRTDVMQIRAELEAIGEPGDPGVMGVLLRKGFGDRYIFDDNASMSEIREWLRNGEFLICHGFFTNAGHVICLDGITIDSSKLSYKISVKDPWSRFDFDSWSYNSPDLDRYDGDYSAHGLYAAIIASQSMSDAIAIYQRRELDSSKKGAWIHRICPKK